MSQNDNKGVLRIEYGMDPEERQRALDSIVRKNPRLQGAKLADALDIAYGADAYLSITEPYFDEHDVPVDDAQLNALAVIALYETYQRVPLQHEVLKLVDAAKAVQI